MYAIPNGRCPARLWTVSETEPYSQAGASTGFASRAYAERAMPLLNLTIAHGQTLEEARRRLETAVHEVSNRFKSGVRRVEWTADRNRVKLEGPGVWVEMWVDARDVHATGDIPILGALLGGPVASGLKQVIERTFQMRLP